MKANILLVLASLLLACNTSSNEEKKTTDTQGENSIVASSTNCYEYATATDTIKLKLIALGDSVTGNLTYILREKDRNVGTITGMMLGSVLVADYVFMSEGIESTRKIAFKKEGDSWVEGYGDFSKPDSLSFNTNMQLKEVACK